MTEEFIAAIQNFQAVFGLEVEKDKITKLADYYELVQKHNPLLHLVAPSSAEEFAVRHILESLTLLEYLPQNAKFADVGAGAGLPSIPCLLVREDLRAALIESKVKKARFLEEVLEKLNLQSRAAVVNKQFEEAEKNFSFVTCRALDKFTEKLPRLLKWAGKANLLFFGGENLRLGLEKNRVKFSEKLMPMSEKRFLFIAEK